MDFKIRCLLKFIAFNLFKGKRFDSSLPGRARCVAEYPIIKVKKFRGTKGSGCGSDCSQEALVVTVRSDSSETDAR